MDLKLGKRAALIPAGVHDLTYYAAGPLPKAPASVAVPDVADWGMLGNDRVGDCGVAGLEHGFMIDAAITHRAEPEASDQQAVDYYFAYTGGQDSGVVLSQYLAYVRRKGYYGHSIKAFAPVAVHDVPTLHTAIDLFGFAYTGIAVTQAMMDAFQAGQPWTPESLQGQVIGGHCIPLAGYDSQHIYAITWGRVQPIAYPAWHYMSDEAWAVITGEFVARNGDGRGIALSALEADLNRLDLSPDPII